MVWGNEANHEGMRNNFSFLLIHCTGHWCYSARWWMWTKGSNVSVLGVMMVGGIEAAHEGMRNFLFILLLIPQDIGGIRRDGGGGLNEAIWLFLGVMMVRGPKHIMKGE